MGINITGEFLLIIIINVISIGISIGSLKTAMAFFKDELKRLEGKQDKYNNLIMRTFRLEERTETQEKKLDELHDDIKDLRDKIDDK